MPYKIALRRGQQLLEKQLTPINRLICQGLRHYLVSFSIFLALAAPSTAATVESLDHSWLGGIGAICEGIGIHGAMRVNLSAQYTVSASTGERRIIHLAVHLTSSAFTGNEALAGATAVVKRNGVELQRVTLVRPTSPVMEPSQKSDESKRVYLPAGLTLLVPKNADLNVIGSGAVNTSQGSCSLGSAQDKIPLKAF